MRRFDTIATWRDRGDLFEGPCGPAFFVDAGDGPPVVILHGFPSASYEWRGVLDRLVEAGRRVLVVDFYGYGYSTKDLNGPRPTLADQAVLVEALLAFRGLGGAEVEILAHDMGDTVAAELAMRAQGGTLGFRISRMTLTNGSIFIDLVHLSPGQQALLSLPDAVLPDRLRLEGFLPGLCETFASPPEDAELHAMLELLAYGEGDRLLPRLIRYIEERRADQARFTQGLVGFAGVLRAGWGMRDPIAVPAMVDELERVRPGVEVTRWADIGHWPAVECPERVVALMLD